MPRLSQDHRSQGVMLIPSTRAAYHAAKIEPTGVVLFEDIGRKLNKEQLDKFVELFDGEPEIFSPSSDKRKVFITFDGNESVARKISAFFAGIDLPVERIAATPQMLEEVTKKHLGQSFAIAH